jgi:uncharacterized radical SAM protein YgiQ
LHQSDNIKIQHDIINWLPTSLSEIKDRGWQELDVILFTGDAYVDHPSFGASVIGRVLENMSLRVAIVPQPNWRDDLRDFKKLGAPALFFGVTSGAMDSMVNHYTANIRKRSDDAYTPGGKAGFRPDYAVNVYTKILKQIYPDIPVIIGGIEASLRRLTHYDYWENKLKASILTDSGADLLVYGMGEKPMIEIVRLLKKGVPFEALQTIPQTAFRIPDNQNVRNNKQWDEIWLHSHDDCIRNKQSFAKNFKTIESESNRISNTRIIQKTAQYNIVVNPPFSSLSAQEMDKIYDLPFTRLPHPRYAKKPPIPAYEMIRHSINIHRGCFGGCSFCTISAHQGKQISSRTPSSITREAKKISQMPDFKGYISDLGGPSANMYGMTGKDQKKCITCSRFSCIYPSVCQNLDTDHSKLITLYRNIAKIPGIKKISIGSGIRYDLFFRNGKISENDKEEYIRQLMLNHISGRLKIAPEHTSPSVLKTMRKPSFSYFIRFMEYINRFLIKNNKRIQIIPYFISSHPGCRLEDMASLAIEVKKHGLLTEQAQDFTPTPMTLASAMYYTGIHPYTGESVYCATSQKEKKMQKAFFFVHNKSKSAQLIKKLKESKQHDIVKILFR